MRVGERAGRGRVGLHPALAGDPRLDPGVGVAVPHDVEPAALVGVRPHAQALDEAGRHSLEAQEDDGRAREVLAVAGLLLEQELGEGVARAKGPGAQRVAVAALQVRDRSGQAPARVGARRQLASQRPHPLVDDRGQGEALTALVVGERWPGWRGVGEPRAVEANRQTDGAPDAPEAVHLQEGRVDRHGGHPARQEEGPASHVLLVDEDLDCGQPLVCVFRRAGCLREKPGAGIGEERADTSRGDAGLENVPGPRADGPGRSGRIPPPAPVEIGEDLGPQEPRARLRVGGSEVEDAASGHAQLRELPERGLARQARLALVEGLGQGPLDLRLEDRQAHDAGCGQRSRQRPGQGEPEHVAPLPARSGLEERRGPEGSEDHEREDEVLLGEGVVVPAPQEGQHRRAVACRRGVEPGEPEDEDQRGQERPSGRERPWGEREDGRHRDEDGRRHQWARRWARGRARRAPG